MPNRRSEARGVDHDEAGYDEEHVDAGLPRESSEPREGPPAPLGERKCVVLRVEHRDRQRSERAQDLEQDELGQWAGAFRAGERVLAEESRAD